MTTMEQSVGAGVYAFRVARTLNGGFVSLMISIGHRTGLFDVMAALPPSTSIQIATAAGLDERYVREWLGAMTTAHVVHYDARTATWFLPMEYAAVLSRGAGTNNLASSAQLITMLAAIEDLVVAGFRGGGGVMPEAYERLNEVMSTEKRELIDESYVDAVLELIPGMRARLEHGATVLDAGCGDGALLITMARMFPRSLFRGYDMSHEAIARAAERVEEADVRNVDFAVGDVSTIDEPRAYDLVMALEVMRELAFPRVFLRRAVAALKNDGMFLLQEVAASSHLSRNLEHPYAPMLYAISTMHSVPVALAQEGEALGVMWGKERAMQLLAEAGFRSANMESLPCDSLRYYCVAGKQ